MDTYGTSFPLGSTCRSNIVFSCKDASQMVLKPVSILGEIGNQRPHIDLHHLALLKNQYEFRGSSLDFLTNKPRDGRHIPNLYAQKKYLEIESYIKNEAAEFISFCQWLSKDMPAILEKFKQS